MKPAPLAIVVVLAVTGCRSSDRSIRIAEGQLKIAAALPLPDDVVPIAASRTGDRIALLAESPGGGETRVVVIDTDTQSALGECRLPKDAKATPMFATDGRSLYVDQPEGYVSWNFTTGVKTGVSAKRPDISAFGLMGEVGWNSDRSIGIARPTQGTDSKGARLTEPGHIAVDGRNVADIPFGSSWGFDSYGHAWYGSGKTWFKVSRAGLIEKGNQPGWLVRDQTRDRGAMHLRDTEQEMAYAGSSAFITCVWLTHDRFVATGRGPQHRAALAYAGPDVITYGFLPGRDMVYVVTQTGSLLVPWKLSPAEP